MGRPANIMRRAVLSGIGAAIVFPVFAGDMHTPGRGDPERKAILDAIRPRIETEMHGPVEFVVRQHVLAVLGPPTGMHVSRVGPG